MDTDKQILLGAGKRGFQKMCPRFTVGNSCQTTLKVKNMIQKKLLSSLCKYIKKYKNFNKIFIFFYQK